MKLKIKDTQHCCANMQKQLDDPLGLLFYDLEDRCYTVSVPKTLLKKNEVWKGYGLQFCLFCGTKLPEPLFEQRAEILEKEYGLDDPYWDEEQKKRIPPEFLTDEWWKKRGL